MKTSLRFQAPGDLSIGTVRIANQEGIVSEWVATPNNRYFIGEDLVPGLYSAEIAPAGISPQSVLFEVVEGQLNTVDLPSFSAMSASSGNAMYLNRASRRADIDSVGKLAVKIEQSFESDVVPLRSRTALEIRADARRISIGVSQEGRSGHDAFGQFKGQARFNLIDGRLDVELNSQHPDRPWHDRRVRLSASIERLRIERCLLPMYRGGTSLVIKAPPFSSEDIELEVVPMDSSLRALIRTLHAGTSDDAQAVRDDILRGNWAQLLDVKDGDPWRAIVCGLLSIRFNNVFSSPPDHWCQQLADLAPWAYDAYVIDAYYSLLDDERLSAPRSGHAVEHAISCLVKAQTTNSPYYAYTNVLFKDLIDHILGMIETGNAVINLQSKAKFDRLRRRWWREVPLQRGAGVSFTWLARDQHILKMEKRLAPQRERVSGNLGRADTLMLFAGQIAAGKISITGRPSGTNIVRSQPDALMEELMADVPALGRESQFAGDPNRGRFGGRRVDGGFELQVVSSFSKRGGWFDISVRVIAQQGAVKVGDFAWIVLDPAMSPAAVKSLFLGARATIRIRWKSLFTIGVWIPSDLVELEWSPD